MLRHWILDDDHQPVGVGLLEWAKWFENGPRTVARTEIGDAVSVSTVFLGLDHSFGSNGPPILFESLVFGGPKDGAMERYSTWEEAEKGHAAMVERCRA